MSGNGYRQQAPPTIEAAIDADYDYKAKSPPSAKSSSTNIATESVDGDEALLDLAKLEELHQEAESMKALGNKHMAAQVCGSVP